MALLGGISHRRWLNLHSAHRMITITRSPFLLAKHREGKVALFLAWRLGFLLLVRMDVSTLVQSLSSICTGFVQTGSKWPWRGESWLHRLADRDIEGELSFLSISTIF